MTFDQAQRAYQFDYSEPIDTEVIDVEEPLVISRPRTSTEDLTMHVYIPDDGSGRPPGWHREAANTMTTSCSTEDDPIPVNMQTDTPKNRRVVEHPLASGRCDCWTRAERREADREYFKKFGVSYKDPTP